MGTGEWHWHPHAAKNVLRFPNCYWNQTMSSRRWVITWIKIKALWVFPPSNNPESFWLKEALKFLRIIKRFQQILKVKIPTTENVKKCLKCSVCKFDSYNWNILEITFRLVENHLHKYSNYEIYQNTWSDSQPTIQNKTVQFYFQT